MDKEWKNPSSVKNNPWVAEIGRGKVVGDWDFRILPKIKIKDFDNLTYDEAKEFQDELINIIIKTLDVLDDIFKLSILDLGSKGVQIKDSSTSKDVKKIIEDWFCESTKEFKKPIVRDNITIYGKLLIYMYDETGEIVEQWFPPNMYPYDAFAASSNRLFEISFGGIGGLKWDNLFTVSIYTFSDLWLKRTIDTEKDNNELAELNAPRLEKIIKQIESIPNFTLNSWGSLSNTNKYFKVGKYGFKQ